MDWKNRWTFWGLVAVVLTLISIPSAELISAFRDYSSLAIGWQPAPLKPTTVSFVPHDDRMPIAPALKPVEFRLKAAKAESVELVGDFNAWKPGLLKMKRAGGGTWTVTLPVRPGRHKYLFLVDGNPQVDPGVETAEGPDGRRVSLRLVK
ncbi:MAG TPA: hypothetical protein DCZ01_11045 [Elusimicrobia bacterium]|nr:hypothetical protein [Elusimicrobiota bacterium]